MRTDNPTRELAGETITHPFGRYGPFCRLYCCGLGWIQAIEKSRIAFVAVPSIGGGVHGAIQDATALSGAVRYSGPRIERRPGESSPNLTSEGEVSGAIVRSTTSSPYPARERREVEVEVVGADREAHPFGFLRIDAGCAHIRGESPRDSGLVRPLEK